MSHSPPKVPLGAILQQAGLVSSEQVRQALEQQHQTHKSQRKRIGEILANKGLINPQTADFFAERWFRIADEQPKQPLGQYLKQAALLNEQQIQTILAEQKQTKVRFGELAIAKGWLKRTTLNFFLRYLMSDALSKSGVLDTERQKLPDRKKADTVSEPNIKTPTQSQVDPSPVSNSFALSNSPTSPPDSAGLLPEPGQNNERRSPDNQEYSQKIHTSFLKIKQKLLNIEGQQSYSEQTIERVLLWTRGQSFLTKKLFALIAQQLNPTAQMTEKEQVDYIVQTQIITNWDQELELHFAGIKQRLLNNHQYQPQELLLLYRQVLAGTLQIDESQPQRELLKMGVVVKQQHQLMVANPIYHSVFSLAWVAKTLNQQRQPKASVSMLPQSTTNSRHQNSWLQVKNVLLLLTIIGLLTILINNIGKRIAVRLAFHRGNKLLQEKSFTPAIAQYNQLLNVDSNYFQAWTNRGYALAGLQKYEEMHESCATATIIEPQAVYAWNCRGEALHNLQRHTEAVAAFDRAIALNQSDPIFLINKSESLRALGRQQESLTVIQEAIRILEQIEAVRGQENISGEFAVALTVLGNGLRQQQQYTDAIQAYQRALDYSANYFPAHIGQGITLIRLEKYQAAQNHLEMTLATLPLSIDQQAQTWFHLGKALCKSEEHAEGRAAFDQAVKLKPDYQAAKAAQHKCR